MRAMLDKMLQQCLSRLKRSNRRFQFHLRSYKHIKMSWSSAKTTTKLKRDRSGTLSDVDQFLFDNFRSLYQEEYEESISSRLQHIDKMEEDVQEERGDCIALLACSENPYEEFKMSMEKIVEARLERNGSVDCGFMDQLLFYFMDLNGTEYYPIILRAFVDLLVDLQLSYEQIPMAQPAWNQRVGRRH